MFDNFIFIALLAISSVELISTIERINKPIGYIERTYIETYVKYEIKQNTLCDLTKEKKVAICNAIFEEESLKKQFRIYLNRTAVDRRLSECEKLILTFSTESTLSDTHIEQDAFACYGRHDPVQTAWDIDDYYQFIYVSAGPVNDSLFLYFRKLKSNGEEYYVREIMRDVKMGALPSISITQQDLTDEYLSLQRLSFNARIDVIEINYIRSFVNQNTHITNSICDLNKEDKIALCWTIFKEYRHLNKFFTLSKDDFSLTDCVEKHIQFLTATKMVVTRKMYPCYGLIKHRNDYVDAVAWRLSDGYRANSVIIYKNSLVEDKFYIDELVENVNIEAIRMANILESTTSHEGNVATTSADNE